MGLGAVTVAGWAAHIVFWALLLVGILNDVMSKWTAIAFAVLWIGGYFALPHFGMSGAFLVTPYVALLDVVLVLVVFRGDVRL
jgi:hypothetical protein